MVADDLTSRPVVAVVGAGLAGLSAALELKRCGFEVQLFERSRLLGGKATSFEVDGVEVDNGQHVFLGCCTEFIDFVRQVERTAGLAGDTLFLQDRFEALLLTRDERPARLQAAPLPAPWHLGLALLRYRHLPPLARLQVGLAILDARKPARDGETFAAWLTRHHPSPAARRAFWDPFLVPALNAKLDTVSAEAALFILETAFLSDAAAARFGYARVPLARVAEAAARTVDGVHLRTPVVGLDTRELATVEPAVEGVILEDGSRVPCDGVVLAIPPARLERILGQPEAFGVFGLADFRHAPIVDVHLWYKRESGRDGGGWVLEGGGGRTGGTRFAALLDSPVQWIFEKEPGYLCCSLSAADSKVSWPSGDLVDLCRKELAAVLPPLRGARLVRSAAIRDREATFVPSPGLKRPGPATTSPRVVIAGAWTDTGWPATMESAVRSGRAAARLLAAQVPQRKEIAVG
jgi:squalene-associated FAD-dependent desaturase